MILKLTTLQVEIALAAVSHHKTLCQNQAALSRRLEISEDDAKNQLANNHYLQSTLDKLAAETGDNHALEFAAPMAARAMRVALIQWVSLAISRDKSAHGATLTTDLGARRSAAQNLVDQLSDQLSLPIEDVAALVAKSGNAKGAARKGKETPTMGTPETETAELFETPEPEDIWADDVEPVVVSDPGDVEVTH